MANIFNDIKTMVTTYLVPTIVVAVIGVAAGVALAKPIKKFLRIK